MLTTDALTDEASVPNDSFGLGGAEMDFLRAAQNGDFSAVKRIADEMCEEPLTVAERINEAFSDSFGDIILEGEGSRITTIEDYKEEIEEWLTKRMR